MMTTAEISRPRSPVFEGKTEKISDGARIAGLLRRIRENHNLLSVTVMGDHRLYNSAIIDLDLDSGYLKLDELSPQSGHRLITVSTPLRIHTRLNGIDISFNTRVEDTGSEHGIAFYLAGLPELVYYRQQREHYRAHVGAGRAVSILLEKQQGEHLEGELHDISAGGVGLRFTMETVHSLEKGEYIPLCVINLGSHCVIRNPVEIRYVGEGKNEKYGVVGARFVDLDTTQRNLISRFVAAIDRETRAKIGSH